jgi:hypothetical protein
MYARVMAAWYQAQGPLSRCGNGCHVIDHWHGWCRGRVSCGLLSEYMTCLHAGACVTAALTAVRNYEQARRCCDEPVISHGYAAYLALAC